MPAGKLFIASAAVLVAGLGLKQWFLAPGPPDLREKRVLLCGASMGIGEELAYEYAKGGARVVIVARSLDKLERIAGRARSLLPVGAGAVHVVQGDFAVDAAIPEVVAKAVELLGGLDLLVLNHITGADNLAPWLGPGGQSTGDGGMAGMPKLKLMMQVNAFSYFALASVAYPHLEATSGAIVVVSSLAGKAGFPFVAAYSASKHALHGFFDSLRHELHVLHSNVTITTCVLGSIDTEGNRQATGDLMRKDMPRADVAQTAGAIVQAGAQRRREIYFPVDQVLPVVLLMPFIPDTLDAIVRSISLQ